MSYLPIKTSYHEMSTYLPESGKHVGWVCYCSSSFSEGLLRWFSSLHKNQYFWIPIRSQFKATGLSVGWLLCATLNKVNMLRLTKLIYLSVYLFNFLWSANKKPVRNLSRIIKIVKDFPWSRIFKIFKICARNYKDLAFISERNIFFCQGL